MRVVLDTNLLVSAFLLKRGIPHEILLAWRGGAFEALTAQELLDELKDVIYRPKFAQSYNVTPQETADFLAFVAARSRLTRSVVAPQVQVRDPDDELLLAVALGGGADFVVTGDKDLLTLEGDPAIVPVRIVSPRAFLKILA